MMDHCQSLDPAIWANIWVVAVVYLGAAATSQTDGIKETENFVKAGTETVGAVSKARMQLQQTKVASRAPRSSPSRRKT